MKSLLIELYSIIPVKLKKKIFLYQLLMVFLSLAELVSVAAIPFFLYITQNVNVLETNKSLITLFTFFNVTPLNHKFLVLALLTFGAVAAVNAFSLFVNYKLTHFSFSLGHEFSTRLFSYYLKRPYLEHTQLNSSNLINNIYNEVARVYSGVINPILQVNTKMFMTIVLVINLLVWDPLLTFLTGFSLAGIYFIIFKITRKKLLSIGAITSTCNKAKYRMMSDAFQGIKEVKQMKIENFYLQSYERASKQIYEAHVLQNLMSISPKHVLETFSFGIMTLVIIYLSSKTNSLNELLPQISLFAITGYKLLPAIQQLFGSISTIKVNIVAFENIKNELRASQKGDLSFSSPKEKLKIKKSFGVRDIHFKYPSTTKPVLKGVSIEVSKGSRVGFVGISGSGKTTLVDIILGILTPDSGEIVVDGFPIQKNKLEEWKNCLSYVPQSIFLTDGTFTKNVALGLDEDAVDKDLIKTCLKKASLSQYISHLPLAEETEIGERGMKLSGGQRQRIGIARALYRDTPILIFDEATSALDGITEESIMDEIYSIDRDKTIILIAHRISTVKKCDKIYYFENGVVADSGSYSELLERNKTFAQMANEDKKS